MEPRDLTLPLWSVAFLYRSSRCFFAHKHYARYWWDRSRPVLKCFYPSLFLREWSLTRFVAFRPVWDNLCIRYRPERTPSVSGQRRICRSRAPSPITTNRLAGAKTHRLLPITATPVLDACPVYSFPLEHSFQGRVSRWKSRSRGDHLPKQKDSAFGASVLGHIARLFVTTVYLFQANLAVC